VSITALAIRLGLEQEAAEALAAALDEQGLVRVEDCLNAAALQGAPLSVCNQS
jgi:hypothetical protein